ncbi:MAG: SAF domain-containing protein [Acetatifactor sp.]|nr:SAF domain-containing protein [Acetatifactor sp.]
MGRKKTETGTAKAIKLWTGAIFAAFIATAAIYAALLQAEKSMLADYEKGEVCFAVKDVPKGQLITEENVREYFAMNEVDAKLIPETAIRKMEEIAGLIAAGHVDQGAMLTTGMFQTINEVTAGMKEPVVAGFRAEDLSQLVGGVLRAGDKIHVYATEEDGETVLIWENIYVQQVFNASGGYIENADLAGAAQRINVFLDKENVEEFYSRLEQGTLRVVKAWE